MCKKVHHAPFSERLFDSIGCCNSYLWIGSGVSIFGLVWGPSEKEVATFSNFLTLPSSTHVGIFLLLSVSNFKEFWPPLTLPKSLLWMDPFYSKIFYNNNNINHQNITSTLGEFWTHFIGIKALKAHFFKKMVNLTHSELIFSIFIKMGFSFCRIEKKTKGRQSWFWKWSRRQHYRRFEHFICIIW